MATTTGRGADTARAERPAVTPADVRDAAARLDGRLVRTPTARSSTLGAITGAEVFVKFEQLQYTASFKERGALNRLLQLDDDARRQGVLAVSAGNHAQGVAYHGKLLGIPATIVMPASTPPTKVVRTRVLGADVLLHGEDFAEAAAFAHALAAERGLTVVHPFDDPAIIAGQGTVALEMLADVDDLDVLVVPVGGGGLISGMAVARLDARRSIDVIGVQVEGYDWAAGQRRPEIPAGPTIAEGIAVRAGGAHTADLVERYVDDVLVVSEDAVTDAVCRYLEIEKVVAEGAAAAPLAALAEFPDVFAGRRCGLVLSGGNIDLRLLAGVALRGLARSGRTAELRVLLDDRPGALARLLAVVADGGANVVEVHHTRHHPDLPVRRTNVVLEIEAGSSDDVDHVVDALLAAGFDVVR